MEQVIIGVDPHKLSATIEVVDGHEHKLGQGRFITDKAGYAALRTDVRAWPARMGGGGSRRGGPAVGAAAAGRRGAGRGRPGEAGRAGPVVRHRSGPQE